VPRTQIWPAVNAQAVQDAYNKALSAAAQSIRGKAATNAWIDDDWRPDPLQGRNHRLFAEALTHRRLLGGGAKFLRMSTANRERQIAYAYHRANPTSKHIHNARWRALVDTYAALQVAAALEQA